MEIEETFVEEPVDLKKISSNLLEIARLLYNAKISTNIDLKKLGAEEK